MINITNNIEDGMLVIVLDGEIDASSSIHLDDAISQATDAGHKKLLIDCNKLMYISSAGLGVFMSYIEDFKSQNIQMVMFGLNKNVMGVFEILGLNQLLEIANDLAEAKAQIESNQPS